MSVTRQQAVQIGAELDAAVKEVLDRHGLVPSGQPRLGYGSNFQYRLEARPVGAPSTFAQYAAWYGLDPALEGRDIVQGGLTYRIEGIAPKSRRYPVLARRNMDGKVFKFTPEAARLAI